MNPCWHQTGGAFWLLVVCSLACSSQPPVAEKSPDALRPAISNPTVVAGGPASPKRHSMSFRAAERAIARVYGNDVKPVTRNAWVVGDFNGDGSEDLAVIVAPVRGATARLNDPLANWIVQQVRNENPAGIPEIQRGDRLLAIVHGDGEPGWRNPEALQSYLVREAAGSRLQPRRLDTSKRPPELRPPVFAGRDVIRQTVDGEIGFVYWDGSRYRWFSESISRK